MSNEELVSICSELRALLERIDDYALEVLRDAASRGETQRPEADKRLVRARRALERALVVLENP